jgi:hypothetical protein
MGFTLMIRIRYLVAGCTTVMLAAAGMLLSPVAAHADTLPSPDTVLQAWNDNFLVVGSGGTYYTSQLKSKGTAPSGTWIAALNIGVAQDAYERTHTPAARQQVSDLVTSFLKKEGTTWTSWDGWNDDIAWMLTAVLRGYQETGNTAWLNTAIDQWNKTYDRGWSGAGGGGIWEEMDSKFSKCSLSNNPMVSTGLWLYQITGDNAYLTKSTAIYSWVKKNLVTSAGVVNECIAFPNGDNGATQLQASDNAYNAGSFIEAADSMYRVTGDAGYRDDAARTADHFLNTVPVVANNGGKGSSYQYWLFKGMSDFCTDNNNCTKYDAYMRSNAAAAWSKRNSANLTWNDWTKPTNESDPDAFEMNGMVGLFQVLPTSAASPFSGSYQIQNVGSKLSLGVKDSSTVNSAAVVQAADAGDGSSWTFVQGSNGYYSIRNVHSGQLLNVSGGSAKVGAQVVQWPAGSLVPGNDQWLPIKNADGSYSFYNRNSRMALDIPAGSTTSGTQAEQWSQSDSAAQHFTLISRSVDGGTTTPPTTGTGAVKSGIAGKCLDLNAGNSTNGTKIQIWGCNGTGAQSWTASGDTLQTSGKCLDATALGTANGTKIQIWDCNGGTNQVWQSYNGGYRNPVSGRCLDDPAASTTDGTQLALWDCNGSAAQKWSAPAA